MNPTVRNQNGMTLPELLVVCVILGGLSALVYGTFYHQRHTFRRETARSEAQGDVRTWVGRMVRDVREAGYDPTESGNFGIVEFDSQAIRFTSDMDQDGTVDSGPQENRGYRLADGSTVLEQWQGGTDWRPVIENVTSFQLTYLDKDGNTVGSVAADIATVDVTITAQASTDFPGSTPPTVTRKAAAEIRNEIR